MPHWYKNIEHKVNVDLGYLQIILLVALFGELALEEAMDPS